MKRRIRIFPIICIIAVVAVAVWAFSLVGDLLNNSEPEEKNDETVTTNKENNGHIPSINDPVVQEPIVEEPVVETPDEDKIEFVADAPKPVYSHATLLEMYPDAVLSEGEDAGQEYIDKMVFIGDSTTHGMAYYGVLKDGKETNKVWTPKSGTLAMWNLLTENIVYPEDDSEMLIADAIAINRPEIVVLTLGVNGVSSLSEKQFIGYYQALIDEIKKSSPDTKIILQSIYPVCDYYEYVNSISMEKINKANTWIAKLANDNSINYLNTISVLVGENGHLKEEYCNGDGIHISREGFNVILDYIRTHSIN